MKAMLILLLTTTTISSFAAEAVYVSPEDAGKNGAVYNQVVENLLSAKKVGLGMVYKNGKAVLKKERECTLLRTDLSTEAFERDGLTIGLTGSPVANDYGINAHGQYVAGKLFLDGAVIYDPVTKEEPIQVQDGIGFQYCVGKSDGPFAGDCSKSGIAEQKSILITSDRIEMYSKEDEKSPLIKATCVFQK